MKTYAKIYSTVIPHGGKNEQGHTLTEINTFLNSWSARGLLIKLPANPDGSLRPNPEFRTTEGHTTIICWRWAESKPVQSGSNAQPTNSNKTATVTKTGAEPMPF